MNQPASSRRRRGLTLVELLAVIAIIGLLVGLLMPAIQSARESSRRTTCTGNLKTLALASLSHLEHIGTFPSAGWPQIITSPPSSLAAAGFNEEQQGGWMFNILPFMECEAIRNSPNAATCPPAFACPTTAAGGAVASTSSGNARRAIVCYAGNMGSGERIPRTSGYVGTTCLKSGSIPLLSEADREAAYPTFVGYGHRIAGVNDVVNPVCPDDNTKGYFLNGIICTFGRVRAAHVPDGMQNTLMLAERPIEVNDLLVLGNGVPCDTVAEWWSWGGWSYWKATRPPEKFIQGHPSNTGCGSGAGPGPFGSRHDSTFGAAFCDGSVRHVGFDVDAVNVWRQLGSRNGREIVSPPW